MPSTFNIEKSVELLEGQAHVWHQVFNFISSMSLKCAIQLGIPEIIHKHGRPMTLLELVEALKISNAKADGVFRLMRILVNSGFFVKENVVCNEEEKVEEGYSLTPSSLLLVESHPFSLKYFVLFQLGQTLTKPWHFLSKWLQNDDEVAFQTAYGKTFWEMRESETSLGNSFDAVMASDTPLLARVITKDYKHFFEGLDSVVDVGGGTGTLAKAIVDAFPHIHCTVLDLPQVVAGLHGTQNLKYVGGDMFDHIPPADAILMKWILHDWGDEECVTILKKCKEALARKGKGGKVMIVDMVVDSQRANHNNYETQIFADVLMMVITRGKERTEKEWAKLFSDAGFTNYKITSFSQLSSIEVYP